MLRTTTLWTGQSGMPGYTTLHFLGTEDQAAADGVAALTEAIWEGLSAVIWSGVTAAVLPNVDVIDPVTGQTTGSFGVTTTPNAMGASGDQQPVAVQGLVQLRTGVYVSGREIRGRVFIPGSVDTADLAGAPNPVYSTSLGNVFSTAITDSAALGNPLAIWSPTRGQAEPVASAAGWTQWAVLRSRRP